ncbi:MAG TPA: hypothetical protein VKD24_05835 [Candidatus Angelobacter sp.]|nr:hypothetical protein [Candidatus Angelobacter sp.]
MSTILDELKGLARRENLSPRERAALALALAILGGESKISLEVYQLLPRKIELLDGVLILTD